MKYINDVFHVLNQLEDYFDIHDSYTELNRFMKNTKNQIILPLYMRHDILSLIDELQVQNIDYLSTMIANPGVVFEEQPRIYKVNELNDTQLINVLGNIMWTVSVNEKDNLMLLKYNECIFNTGWHNYALQSRGKVIDKTTMEVVSYPFNKFFNLNEVQSSEENVIVEHLRQADHISLTNKLDGSTIIVSNYNGKALCTTNGAFENYQIDYAMDIFNEKYKEFINNVPAGYTFIFELIHPDNRIIIDYGDIKDVFLTAVRDNSLLENGLLSYEKQVEMAEKYHLKVVEQEVFTNLNDLCNKARTMKNAQKEGWVIRTEINGYVNFMFKLKLEEYFILHRAKAHVSIKNIYSLYLQNKVEEFTATVDENTKQEVIDMIEEINMYLGKTHQEIASRGDELIVKYNLPRGRAMEKIENRDKLMIVLEETKKDKLFGSYVLKYIKGYEPAEICQGFRVKKFMEIYEYFNNQ
jgi:RNA ligase